ncbi:MAG TPA: M23 family metallopeptidase [Spirochaetota bacterium]|nr:M23 family metallopeptidase [Spirochaetota bacterium]HOM86832.1 M23 family metallopeptidase [Spirochaetota bacterium]HOR92374.1 M23 family metallopeptidase [Spirochaetota bacterium]HOT18443.1 M23 family metallopeptidase [Spirochaetota bacterium]HPD03774.1 M23 family metallopeptidase [Spirochaetota bacterium]
MKVRIKIFKSNIERKLKEKYYLKKKQWLKKWDKVLEHGHEKMTIMFIPHNEQKIFNFQISRFTILFFTTLLVIVLVTSSYAIIKNTAVKREEERLLSNYKDIRSQIIRFEQLTNELGQELDKIKPDIEDLYDLATNNNNSTSIWESSVVNNEDPSMRQYASILPSDIQVLRSMQKDLLCTTNTVKTIKNFIDVRNKVIYDTPSIIPNPGHITSLFGWRRSPFGFDRDFHSGIDIAAPQGTEIRATAPGIVISASWGGGYGYMVRIRHKYGYETIYGHCSKIIVSQGQSIKKGQIIAYVGQTGSATGSHCHYEIRIGGVAINPYPYMSKMW